MGCDIHLCTEVKDITNGVKKWRNCDDWRLNRYYEKGVKDGESEYNIHSIYNDRDYELFTALAGVRQYNEKNIPIGEPRGLPDDCSDAVKKQSKMWGADGHSHSYLTFAEVEKYFAEHGNVYHSGLVHPDAAKLLLEKGETPEEWCQGSSNKSMVWVEWTEPFLALQKLLSAMEVRMRDELWIFHGKSPTPEQKEYFRIVFWFDN